MVIAAHRTLSYLFSVIRSFFIRRCFRVLLIIVISALLWEYEQSLAQAQLRLTAPALGERLTPGGEFLIQWSGISAQDTVQISYSPDAGKTWRLITPIATGLSFRWRNIPFTISDSCQMVISTKPRDNSNSIQNSITAQERSFSLRFGSQRLSSQWLQRWVGYTFDGNRLITTSSVGNDDSLRQLYRTQIWDAVSGQRIFALPDFVRDSSLRFSAETFTPRIVQGSWSPDNTLVVNVIDETSFGIYESASGRLIRRVAIPIDGFKTSLQYVTWSNDGREMIARVLYRTQGTGAAGTVITDRFIRFQLSDMLNTPVTLSSSSIVFDRWGNTYLGLLPNGRQWLSVRRSPMTGQTEDIVLHLGNSADSTRTFTPPGGFIWRPETILSSPSSEFIALRATTTRVGQPPLLIVINLQTGSQRSLSATSLISWSPDSRKLLIRQDNAVQPEILDVATLESEAILQNLYAAPTDVVLSTTNILGFVPTGQTNIAWSANSRRITGYNIPVSAIGTPLLTASTSASVFGVWDITSGCQTETSVLPRLPAMRLPLEYNLNETGSLIFSNLENQLVVTNRVKDSSLVLAIPNIAGGCQTSLSAGQWAIRLPNLLQSPESFIAQPIVCENSALIRIPVTNLSNSSFQIDTRLQALAGEELAETGFRLERSPQAIISGRLTDTAFVRFTPVRFGSSSVQLVIRSAIGDTVLARTIITARKDSLAFEPAAPVVNVGLIPAKTLITTTITIRNTGNTPLVWSTGATRTTSGNIFITEITPLFTPIGGTSEIRLRIQPIDSLGRLSVSLPLYFCGANTSILTVQARVLPEFQQIDVPSQINGGLLTCVGVVHRTLTIRNLGGRMLTLRTLGIADTNFRILNTPTLPLTLAPLDSLVIALRLSTPTNGLRESRCVILSDDPTRPLLEIPVQLEQQAPIYTWIPSQYRFENVDIRQSAETTLEFQNTGQAYLWTGLPRQINPDFTIVSVSPNPTPQGGISRVVVRFNGNPQSGIISTIASFNLGDICNTQTQLPLEAITIQPAAKLTVRTIVPFDTLLCTSEQTQRAELLNTGRADLRIDSIYIENSIGAGRSTNPDFLVQTDNAAPFPLRIGGVQTIAQVFFLNVIFRPQGTGIREGWLVIHSNDTTTNSRGIMRIPLRGIRLRSSFTLTPETVRFQVQSNFMRDTTAVLITNTGTEPLVWQDFPRTIDPLFFLEAIEPPVTPPQGVSRAIIRFAGIRTTETTSGSYTLINPLCNASQTLRFSAGSTPEATLAPIPPVAVRLLCSSDTTVNISLRNTGSAPLTFTEPPRILDDALTEIRITTQLPTNIPPGASATLVANIRPQRPGTRTVRLLLATNDRINPRQEPSITFTKDSSALQWETTLLNLGTVQFGETLQRTIRLQNLGTVEQRIATPLQVANLSIDSISLNPIPAGRSAEIFIRFVATSSAVVNGLFSGSLTVQDACGRLNTLNIRASAQDGEIAMPDSLTLAPLAEGNFPIFFRRRTGIANGEMVNIFFRIANTSLVQVLTPANAMQGLIENRIVNGARLLRFSVPVSASSDTLITMRFRGLLGNDSATTLTIDSAFVSNIALRGAISRFKTLGLNYAGSGTRLYFTPLVKVVAPNPASEQLSVSIDAAESATIVLRLINVLGQATSLYEGSIEAGSRDFRFPLEAIPTGTYTLEMRSTVMRFPNTPPERFTMRINIVK